MQFIFTAIFFFQILFLHGQERIDKVNFSLGLTSIPLHIERTDITRWMVFPSIDVGYRINNKLAIHLSYLLRDIRKYRGEERDSYLEAPSLTSFEIASIHIGKKFTLSRFSDYIFAGLNYEHFRTELFHLQANIALG